MVVAVVPSAVAEAGASLRRRRTPLHASGGLLLLLLLLVVVLLLLLLLLLLAVALRTRCGMRSLPALPPAPLPLPQPCRLTSKRAARRLSPWLSTV